MAGYIGSVGLTGYIAPADTLDTYALQSEVFNRGGFRAVADKTERNAITADRRKLGMLVYNIADNSYYTLLTGLTNSDWQPAPLGGSNTYVGLSDTPTDLIMSGLRSLGFASPINGAMEHTYQIGSNIKYLQAADNIMTDETSFFLCSNFSSAGEVFLPYIDYFNGRIQGQLLMVMGHSTLEMDVKPQDAAMGGGSSDDSLRDLNGNIISNVHLKVGQTAMFTSFYDDPQQWVFLGYLGGDSISSNVETISIDSTRDLAGTYFIDKDNVLLEFAHSLSDRRFTVKSQGVSCRVTVEDGFIDGVEQEIQLSPNSCVEIFAKADNTYWILNIY